MAPTVQLNSGPLPLSMQCSSIIAVSTVSPGVSHMKDGSASSPTFVTFVCLAHGFASSTPASKGLILTSRTSPGSSVATSTMKNITYPDLRSGLVESCRYAVFSEAYYCEPSRPPAAQLVYDLGLVVESDLTSNATPDPAAPAPCPHIPTKLLSPKLTNPIAPHLPLPMRLIDASPLIAARASKMTNEKHWA